MSDPILHVAPQIHKTADGQRLITHGVFSGQVFLAYARCHCVAELAIKEIQQWEPRVLSFEEARRVDVATVGETFNEDHLRLIRRERRLAT